MKIHVLELSKRSCWQLRFFARKMNRKSGFLQNIPTTILSMFLDTGSGPQRPIEIHPDLLSIWSDEFWLVCWLLVSILHCPLSTVHHKVWMHFLWSLAFCYQIPGDKPPKEYFLQLNKYIVQTLKELTYYPNRSKLTEMRKRSTKNKLFFSPRYNRQKCHTYAIVVINSCWILSEYSVSTSEYAAQLQSR